MLLWHKFYTLELIIEPENLVYFGQIYNITHIYFQRSILNGQLLVYDYEKIVHFFGIQTSNSAKIADINYSESGNQKCICRVWKSRHTPKSRKVATKIDCPI